ncbi:hypothetical protein [Arthrobacter sp. ZGTC212]|uniref:hypothetical protein n=1 Tax=Arthrobacter sp. ZGTC212 TaxID=2058899 RepID=UPI002157B8EE|nr:hypothetical protein [Arthrobacter sp. ZGTC212]
MSEQNNRDQRGAGSNAAHSSSSSDKRDDRGRPATNDRNAPKRFEDRKPSFGGRPARDGERKSFGDRGASSERKPYSKDRKPSFGDRPARGDDDRRPARDNDRKPAFGDRGDRKPSFGDRPARGGDDRRPARDNDRKPSFGDRGDRKPSFGGDDRRPSRDGERKPFSERSGERKSFGDRGDRKPSFGDRGDRKPSFGDRPARDNDRKPSFGDRKPSFGDRGDRKPSFGGDDRRPPRDGERKPFSERSGERKSFGDRGDRKPSFGDRGDRKPSFGDRPARGGDDRRPARDNDRKPSFGGDDRRPPRDGERKSFGDRGDRKPSFGDRPARGGDDRRPARDNDRKPSFGDRGDRKPSFSKDRPARGEDAPVVEHKHNARDLRSANRPDRERSPEIDDDVTGQELDKVTRAQLRVLEEVNGEWVSKHLVMAGRLIDIDPELAFQHALAASRRGGRMAAVREAVALTAYASENFAEALREFRTYRRISGSNAYLAMMADCERGLGRADRALDIARSDEAKELDTAGQVDMAIVASGARMDMEQYDAAVTALEIPQLDKNRAFSFSPRLFRAYADALELADRNEEVEQWRNRALLAEKALGIGEFAEPDIYDLDDEEEKPEKPRRGREDRESRDDHRGAERSDTPFAAPVETEPADANGDLDLTDDVDTLPSDDQEGVIGVLEAEEEDDDNTVEQHDDGNDNEEFSADAPSGDVDEDRS